MVSGTGKAPGLSFNRRYLMTDGRVRCNPGGSHPRIVAAAGPVDPDLHFVLFRLYLDIQLCRKLNISL